MSKTFSEAGRMNDYEQIMMNKFKEAALKRLIVFYLKEQCNIALNTTMPVIYDRELDRLTDDLIACEGNLANSITDYNLYLHWNNFVLVGLAAVYKQWKELN